jgi:hypothetical protein
VKWAGVVVCVVLLGVWILSERYYAIWIDSAGRAIGIGNGQLLTGHLGGGRSDPHGYHAGLGFGWLDERHGPSRVRWWFYPDTDPNMSGEGVPLWLLMWCVGFVTVIAWALDVIANRHVSLDRCQKCNYSLRGLPAASPCPECGTQRLTASQSPSSTPPL